MGKSQLLDRVRQAIRVRQYSRATEVSYVAWIRRYILFHGKRHPSEMGKYEIEALLFLYRSVLEVELPWLDDVIRAKPKRRVPVVLSQAGTGALGARSPLGMLTI